MTPIFTVDDFLLFTIHPCCMWLCQDSSCRPQRASRRYLSNELAPEARKKLAPAEGRGFRFVVGQPPWRRKIVRIHLSALQASATLVCQGPLASRGCCPNRGVATFPLLCEEGWLRDQEKRREASLVRADGVVFNLNKILWNLITTPSAPKRKLHDILLRSRPPLLGGENCGTLRFVNSLTGCGFISLP